MRISIALLTGMVPLLAALSHFGAAKEPVAPVVYHVSVDGVAQPDGTKSFPGLTWGSHTIAVTAYDAAGNVSAPTSLTVTSAWRAG